MSIQDPSVGDAKPYVEAYQRFATNLRAWLIAYGIGAPVLFASQDAFSSLLANTSAIAPVIYAFLAGMAVQVFAAFLYKATMWYIMWGALNEQFKLTRRYKLSNWVSEQLWLELLFDLASIGAFAWATTKILILYTG